MTFTQFIQTLKQNKEMYRNGYAAAKAVVEAFEQETVPELNAYLTSSPCNRVVKIVADKISTHDLLSFWDASGLALTHNIPAGTLERQFRNVLRDRRILGIKKA